jgi:hypothetical protein
MTTSLRAGLADAEPGSIPCLDRSIGDMRARPGRRSGRVGLPLDAAGDQSLALGLQLHQRDDLDQRG